MNTTQTPSPSTNPKKPFPVLGALLFFTFFFLLSCDDTASDDKDSAPPAISTLKGIIEAGEIPTKSELEAYEQGLQGALAPYVGKSIGIVYVTKDGGSDTTKDGSTREKAYAATQLKTAIDAAGTAAIATKPYLVLLAPGTYSVSATLSMKNNVLIAGGIAEDGSLSSTKTILDGGDSTQIFSNTDLNKSAALYGVSITNGKTTGNGGGMANSNSSPSLTQVIFSGNTADNGGGMSNSSSSSPSLIRVTFSGNTVTTFSGGNGGGGMANRNSSPSLTQVTFSSNTSTQGGGGMYNDSSSPILTQVTFSNNSAISGGGGMYNNGLSSPILTQVTFSNNSAINGSSGGGMSNNNSSSPILTQVTFSGNAAIGGGFAGGMLNDSASPNLTQVTFFGNAASQGSAIYNNINGRAGPTIVNSIFWGNTVGTGTATRSSQIYIYNDAGTNRIENLSIHNSVLQDGIAGFSYEVAAVGSAAPADTNVVSSGIIAGDPKLKNANITLYPGATVEIPKIQASSPAINKGLYIRENGGTYYYSENATTWYTGFDAMGLSGTGTPPAAAIDLTAKDITGRVRTGRPDIGAYEFR